MCKSRSDINGLVASITHSVAVPICLERVGYIRAIVTGVTNRIAVSVLVRMKIARVANAITIAVNLVCVGHTVTIVDAACRLLLEIKVACQPISVFIELARRGRKAEGQENRDDGNGPTPAVTRAHNDHHLAVKKSFRQKSYVLGPRSSRIGYLLRYKHRDCQECGCCSC